MASFIPINTPLSAQPVEAVTDLTLESSPLPMVDDDTANIESPSPAPKKRIPKKFYTKDDDAYIIASIQQKLGWSAIAEHLGRTPVGVSRHWYDMIRKGQVPTELVASVSAVPRSCKPKPASSLSSSKPVSASSQDTVPPTEATSERQSDHENDAESESSSYAIKAVTDAELLGEEEEPAAVNVVGNAQQPELSLSPHVSDSDAETAAVAPSLSGRTAENREKKKAEKKSSKTTSISKKSSASHHSTIAKPATDTQKSSIPPTPESDMATPNAPPLAESNPENQHNSQNGKSSSRRNIQLALPGLIRRSSVACEPQIQQVPHHQPQLPGPQPAGPSQIQLPDASLAQPVHAPMTLADANAPAAVSPPASKSEPSPSLKRKHESSVVDTDKIHNVKRPRNYLQEAKDLIKQNEDTQRRIESPITDTDENRNVKRPRNWLQEAKGLRQQNEDLQRRIEKYRELTEARKGALKEKRKQEELKKELEMVETEYMLSMEEGV